MKISCPRNPTEGFNIHVFDFKLFIDFLKSNYKNAEIFIYLSDEIISIINYLEENNTDINFHGAKTQNFYNRFRNIEKKVQMSKMLIGSKTEVQKMIEKVESVKVQERPDWLDYYKNEDDEDETNVNGMPTSDRDKNLGQDIIDRLTSEVKERIDNEPGITLEEIREQMNNEINNN